jgi:predicted ATPase
MLRGLSSDWEATAAIAAELCGIGTRHGIAMCVAVGTIVAGIASTAKGDVLRGADQIREGIAGFRQTGAEIAVPLVLAYLALALSASGDAKEALDAADEALRAVRANGGCCWEAEVLRSMGEVKRVTGAANGVEIETDLRAAVDVARRQGAKAFELRAATSLCRLLAADGRRREAHDLLAPVYARFTEGLDTPDLEEAKALLDKL